MCIRDRFRDISFDTIAGYAQHGAIVHYEETPEIDVVLKPEGLIPVSYTHLDVYKRQDLFLYMYVP